jgi:hypothetical protein
MFKAVRVTILLFILVIVGGVTWVTKYRALKWDKTLDVVIYPINADKSDVSRAYITSLQRETFQPIATMMQDEAKRYGVVIDEPVRVWLAPELDAIPPSPPAGGNIFSIMTWSLKLRYWASQNDHFERTKPNIRLFALFHDPARTPVLAHSLGLEKGMLGVANVFASRRQAGSNNVVLAHEMLHTLGATDKYDLQTTLPIFPDGYAEPNKNPRYPQELAELMSGRIPVNEKRAEIPDDLTQCTVGAATARELRWLK